MKFLILGASGLVGWNLHGIAISQAHETLGTYASHPIPGLIPLRMEDQSALDRLICEFRPEVIFYCAGWTWVDGCESDPAKAHLENVELPAQAARSGARVGARFIYFSSSYVFNGIGGPYAEEAAPHPVSVYGRSKLEGEMAVFKATGDNALIARTMGVYGPEPQQKNFVYQVRKTLGSGQSMRVPNDQFGNVTYAPDLARMAIELAQQNHSGIWNLAGPDSGVRRSDFARQIAQTYGLSPDLIQPMATSFLRQPAPRPMQGGLLIEKVIRATSIIPQPWVKLP